MSQAGRTSSSGGGGFLPDSSVLVYSANTQLNATGAGTLVTVGFDTKIYDVNNDFNIGTYTYTAPATGKYLVISNCNFADLGAANLSGAMLITTSNRAYVIKCNYANLRAADNTTIDSITTIADMDLGDTLTIDVTVTGGGQVIDILASPSANELTTYLAIKRLS